MLDQKKHRKILFEIIKEIYDSPIAAWLGFKGGTMLYFFYGLDRFSVDLDFDLLNAERTPEVFAEVKNILKKYGTIEDAMNKNFTLLFELRYETGQQSVKIEINKRITKTNSYETRNFYGTEVKVLLIADSFAHKLIAAMNRKAVANRDFYDIWFLFKRGFIPNEKVIQEISGKNSREYCADLAIFIEKNFSKSNPLAGLGELVDEKQKSWIKEFLKRELRAQINFFIKN
ncbi:MAG: hypothetical protein CO141_03805 [Candidatus Moranbacteria bacterium CG_4_9_14_3_um_filter_42_9]|nr:MAG: hypothetical protein CO141_03805 [Candidatus Moranbacteria bacterium CG_4_9_14_3_um_filter_42_9]